MNEIRDHGKTLGTAFKVIYDSLYELMNGFMSVFIERDLTKEEFNEIFKTMGDIK